MLEFTASLRANPGFLRTFQELWSLRASGALAAPRLEQSLAGLEQALPGDPHWPCYSGLLAHHEGRIAEAIQKLRLALDRLPLHAPDPAVRAEARLALADSLYKAGQRDEALEGFRALVDDRFTPPPQRGEATRILRELESRPERR